MLTKAVGERILVQLAAPDRLLHPIASRFLIRVGQTRDANNRRRLSPLDPESPSGGPRRRSMSSTSQSFQNECARVTAVGCSAEQSLQSGPRTALKNVAKGQKSA